jgi:hypothetical protein
MIPLNPHCMAPFHIITGYVLLYILWGVHKLHDFFATFKKLGRCSVPIIAVFFSRQPNATTRYFDWKHFGVFFKWAFLNWEVFKDGSDMEKYFHGHLSYGKLYFYCCCSQRDFDLISSKAIGTRSIQRFWWLHTEKKLNNTQLFLLHQ